MIVIRRKVGGCFIRYKLHADSIKNISLFISYDRFIVTKISSLILNFQNFFKILKYKKKVLCPQKEELLGIPWWFLTRGMNDSHEPGTKLTKTNNPDLLSGTTREFPAIP